jgi:hypothetical protein
VVDGGDIGSVKFVAAELKREVKDNTCVCHMLNNLIKRCVTDYLDDVYLAEWRTFIKHLNQSQPFREAWDRVCQLHYNEKKVLQKDTPTRCVTMRFVFPCYCINLIHFLQLLHLFVFYWNVLFVCLFYLLFLSGLHVDGVQLLR